MIHKKVNRVENLVGVAATLSLLVGFIAMLVAVVSLIFGDFSASGLSLIAAALGFGLFSLAVLNG